MIAKSTQFISIMFYYYYNYNYKICIYWELSSFKRLGYTVYV